MLKCSEPAGEPAIETSNVPSSTSVLWDAACSAENSPNVTNAETK
jgi:hypothetical protein